MNLEQIWNDYAQLLRGFLLNRVKTPEDAEDLMQEILIKTHRKMGSLQDPKSVKAWLFQIARNTLIDHYRKESKFGTSESPNEFADIKEEDDETREIVRQELSQCLLPFIKKLPPKYGDAVEAIDLNGIPQKEFAEKLGLSLSGAKSRVQRGRQKLAELFQECCTYDLDVRGNVIHYQKKPDCC